MRVLTFASVAALSALLFGCTTPIQFGSNAPALQVQLPEQADDTDDHAVNDSVPSTFFEQSTDQPDLQTSSRRVSALNRTTRDRSIGSQERPELEGEEVNVTLASQPLPAFINTVFGEVIQVPFSLGPGISERNEVVSLRSVRDMSRQTFLALVEEALKDYGVGVSYENGLYRVVALDELRAQMPQFIRSRSRSGVPAGLRPVVQFIELSAIDAADMETVLTQAFPDRNQLSIRTNRLTNSIVITGLADDVNGALAIIEQMDELRFANTQVITFTPRNWEAQPLANDLSNILRTEGYFVSVSAGQPRAIVLLPLVHTNQILIFARDRSVTNYILSLARQLDADAYRAEAQIAQVYQVRNTDATALANMVATATGSAAGASLAPSATSGDESETAAGGSLSSVTALGNLTVDTAGNRIIFFGTQAEYDQVSTLFRLLDTPIPEVLIEVTIAEVTLTDNMNYGLDAIFDTATASSFAARLTTGSNISSVVQTGQVNLSASAAAGNNQINVLSTPRVIARSGSEGYVQVGTDVPVITSQRAAPTQSSGSSDVLQTVDYRSTGVIMTVTPTVYSGQRIDLKIDQEVSSAEANSNAAIASPIISNRRMTSELSLQDGQTAVLGGLIENRFTRGNNGVPFLKDVPFIGAPFRSETFNSTRTMLVILVTPYILDTRRDRQAVVDSLVRAINEGYENQTVANPTLTPPEEPMQIRPRAAAESE